MDWTAWIAPGAAFIGAGLAFVGAWVGVRQRERAGRRAEWGRRFETALGYLADGADVQRRRIGRIVLRSLATSEFATAEDRSLADLVLADELIRGVGPPQIAAHESVSGREDGPMDEPAGNRHNGDNDPLGGAR